VLYHGTNRGAVAAIERQGLRKKCRHHVHLSADMPTALAVGHRHGIPVVFGVDCAAMHADGFTSYCAENGVWLVNSVPPHYLRMLAAPQAKRR
jgi:putative RNA 2'-phosphotransferase